MTDLRQFVKQANNILFWSKMRKEASAPRTPSERAWAAIKQAQATDASEDDSYLSRLGQNPFNFFSDLSQYAVEESEGMGNRARNTLGRADQVAPVKLKPNLVAPSYNDSGKITDKSKKNLLQGYDQHTISSGSNEVADQLFQQYHKARTGPGFRRAANRASAVGQWFNRFTTDTSARSGANQDIILNGDLTPKQMDALGALLTKYNDQYATWYTNTLDDKGAGLNQAMNSTQVDPQVRQVLRQLYDANGQQWSKEILNDARLGYDYAVSDAGRTLDNAYNRHKAVQESKATDWGRSMMTAEQNKLFNRQLAASNAKARKPGEATGQLGGSSNNEDTNQYTQEDMSNFYIRTGITRAQAKANREKEQWDKENTLPARLPTDTHPPTPNTIQKVKTNAQQGGNTNTQQSANSQSANNATAVTPQRVNNTANVTNKVPKQVNNTANVTNKVPTLYNANKSNKQNTNAVSTGNNNFRSLNTGSISNAINTPIRKTYSRNRTAKQHLSVAGAKERETNQVNKQRAKMRSREAELKARYAKSSQAVAQSPTIKQAVLTDVLSKKTKQGKPAVRRNYGKIDVNTGKSTLNIADGKGGYTSNTAKSTTPAWHNSGMTTTGGKDKNSKLLRGMDTNIKDKGYIDSAGNLITTNRDRVIDKINRGLADYNKIDGNTKLKLRRDGDNFVTVDAATGRLATNTRFGKGGFQYNNKTGKKIGYDSTRNTYLAANKVRNNKVTGRTSYQSGSTDGTYAKNTFNVNDPSRNNIIQTKHTERSRLDPANPYYEKPEVITGNADRIQDQRLVNQVTTSSDDRRALIGGVPAGPSYGSNGRDMNVVSTKVDDEGNYINYNNGQHTIIGKDRMASISDRGDRDQFKIDAAQERKFNAQAEVNDAKVRNEEGLLAHEDMVDSVSRYSEDEDYTHVDQPSFEPESEEIKDYYQPAKQYNAPDNEWRIQNQGQVDYYNKNKAKLDAGVKQLDSDAYYQKNKDKVDGAARQFNSSLAGPKPFGQLSSPWSQPSNSVQSPYSNLVDANGNAQWDNNYTK